MGKGGHSSICKKLYAKGKSRLEAVGSEVDAACDFEGLRRVAHLAKAIPLAALLRRTEERRTKRIYPSDRLWVRCDLMREMDRTGQFEVTVL
jgi:hypothetical protein